MPLGEATVPWTRAREFCNRVYELFDHNAALIEVDTQAKWQFLVGEWGVLQHLTCVELILFEFQGFFISPENLAKEKKNNDPVLLFSASRSFN